MGHLDLLMINNQRDTQPLQTVGRGNLQDSSLHQVVTDQDRLSKPAACRG